MSEENIQNIDNLKNVPIDNLPVEDVLAALSELFKIDDKTECTEEYVETIERLTNHICGKESFEEILYRQAVRLANKYVELGENAFTNKLGEFVEIINKEEEEYDKLFDNITEKTKKYFDNTNEDDRLEKNRKMLRYDESSYFMNKHNDLLFETDNMEEMELAIRSKIDQFNSIDRAVTGDAIAYRMANHIDNMFNEFDKIAKTTLDQDSLNIHNEKFNELCDLWFDCKWIR
jgi:hypothetical protein